MTDPDEADGQAQADREAELLELVREGGDCFLREDWEAAAEVFRRATQRFPLVPYVFRSYGRALENLERYPEAEAAYGHAVWLKPDDATSHHGVGAAMLYQLTERGAASEEYSPCIAALKTATNLAPHDASKYNDLAYAHLQAGNHAQAYRYYVQSLARRPYHPATFAYFNVLLRGSGRHEEAIREFAAMVEERDDQAGLWYVLGRLYHATGDGENARRCLREAVLRSPGLREAHRYLEKLGA